MDNTNYQSVQKINLQLCPLEKSKLKTGYIKKTFRFWCETRVKLIAKVKQQHRILYNKVYKMDEMVFEHGQEIIRLLHYHCQHNLEELIWAHIK